MKRGKENRQMWIEKDIKSHERFKDKLEINTHA